MRKDEPKTANKTSARTTRRRGGGGGGRREEGGRAEGRREAEKTQHRAHAATTRSSGSDTNQSAGRLEGGALQLTEREQQETTNLYSTVENKYSDHIID